MIGEHAFASGPVYGRSKAVAPGPMERFFRQRFGSFLRFQRTPHEVWENFESSGEIDKSCKLGPNAWCISQKKRVFLGQKVICRGILRCELFGDGEIVVGNDAYIGDNVIISAAASVRIGARTLIAHGVEIFDNDTHPLDPHERWIDYQCILGKAKDKPNIPAAPVMIGEDCWLGSGVFIGKGVRIGNGSVVAARSVVTRDVPPAMLVAGNPARQIRALGT